MTDYSKYIKPPMDDVCQEFVDRIYRAISEHPFEITTGSDRKIRRHLGMSQLGTTCDRCLWYAFMGYQQPKPEPRLQALFDLGFILEDYLSFYIKKAGYDLHSEQKRYNILNGLIPGATDGIIENLEGGPYQTDFKSINKKGMETVMKEGTKKARPKYYTQINSYAYEEDSPACLMLYSCKDDSSLYAERFPRDDGHVIETYDRVERVIKMDEPPPCNGSFMEKKFCNYAYLTDIEKYMKLKNTTCAGCVYFTVTDSLRRACTNPKHSYYIKNERWQGGCLSCKDRLTGGDVWDRVSKDRIKEFDR